MSAFPDPTPQLGLKFYGVGIAREAPGVLHPQQAESYGVLLGGGD